VSLAIIPLYKLVDGTLLYPFVKKLLQASWSSWLPHDGSWCPASIGSDHETDLLPAPMLYIRGTKQDSQHDMEKIVWIQ